MRDVETQSLKLFFGSVQFDRITSMAERNGKLTGCMLEFHDVSEFAEHIVVYML